MIPGCTHTLTHICNKATVIISVTGTSCSHVALMKQIHEALYVITNVIKQTFGVVIHSADTSNYDDVRMMLLSRRLCRDVYL